MSEHKLRLLSLGAAVTVVLVGDDPPIVTEHCTITNDPREAYRLASVHGLPVTTTLQARLARFAVPSPQQGFVYHVPDGLAAEVSKLLGKGVRIRHKLQGETMVLRMAGTVPVDEPFLRSHACVDGPRETRGVFVCYLTPNHLPVAHIIHSGAQALMLMDELPEALIGASLHAITEAFEQLPPESAKGLYTFPSTLADMCYLAATVEEDRTIRPLRTTYIGTKPVGTHRQPNNGYSHRRRRTAS